jgi:hypothetical protein
VKGMTRRRFGAIVGGAALALAAAPGRAYAATAPRYGVNYPNGMAAVDYAYGPDGTWRPQVDVSYRWNYYQQYATAAHPYDRDALFAYADGTHNATARDANGHLLLDFDHDGEIDFTGGGSAFWEHNGRGAGNAVLATPFSNFWFDDNWLARYVAQAYNRPLPNGLSAYPDFNRWQILAGDTTAWTPYGSDFFDILALDGLYWLARGQASTALAKWTRIRDTSGAAYDSTARRYRYPNIAENYHVGLFKILTEHLLAAGQSAAELTQHSVSLRSAIVENQQPSGAALTGWTSGVVPGRTLMNTESLAVNVLALGAGARTTYGAGQPPLGTTDNGYAWHPDGVLTASAGTSRPGHMTYGPYARFPVGTYTVHFVLRCIDPTSPVAHLDVYDAAAGRVLAGRDVTGLDLGGAGRWGRAPLTVSVANPTNSLELRTWWYGCGDLDVAEIRVG